MLEKNDWTHIYVFAVAAGAAVGLTISLLPQSFFYETASYYSGAGELMSFGLFYEGSPSGIREFLYFILFHKAYFLSVRLFLPAVFLFIGMLRKRTILPQLYLTVGLIAVSIQAGLIFGAAGMEGWFRYQLIDLLPQSFYLLAAIRVYFFKKQEIHTIRSFTAGSLQMILLLLCGAGLEICLNLLQYLQNVCIMS